MFHAKKLQKMIKYDHTLVIVEIIKPGKISLQDVFSLGNYPFLSYKLGHNVQNEDMNYKTKCLLSQ